MGELINLNQFRKRRERELEESRTLNTRTRVRLKKAERKALLNEIEQRRRELDGKRFDQRPSDE